MNARMGRRRDRGAPRRTTHVGSVNNPTAVVVREEYEPWQWSRFTVPQGMTGWWQINRRGYEHQHLCTADDLYYIQNYSLLLDFQILARTLLVVLTGQGAY